MEICKILINKIEKLCDTNNITTNQMLLKCGLAKDVVNNMKKEKPSIPSVDKIYAIAQYFNVSSDYLLGLDDVPNRKENISEVKGTDKQAFNMFSSLSERNKGIIIGRMEEMIKEENQSKNAETA